MSQSLQQTLSQLLTSLLTVIGILVMMVIISPLLALIAIVAVPLTLAITIVIAKRSQKLFVAQWAHTGTLNAQIEEGYTGHALVKVFGRHKEVGVRFDEKNEELYKASFGAQFISGIIMPATMFVGNLVYVGIAVVGGLLVANGSIRLGDVQAFIQYSRQFTQPLSQLGSMANLLQSGVASAERVFELLDADEQSADPVPAQSPATGGGRLAFENVSFRYEPEKPLIDDLSLVAEPGQTVAIVGPTGAGKTTLVNLIMRFYEPDARTHHARRRRHPGDDPRRPARSHRHGAAGHLAVRRDDPRQHRLRPTGRDRGGDHGGGDRGLRRPLRARAAGRLRHPARRRGRQRQRRREAADHDRAGVPRPAERAHPRRGDELGRHPHRGARAAGDARAAARIARAS